MPSAEAVELARRLRDLRASRDLTQASLSAALSEETRVAVPTISSWESVTTPKLPPKERLRSYALFFAHRPAEDGSSHLPREQDLTAAERDDFRALHQELITLRDAVVGVADSTARGTSLWMFENDDPITIVCPEVPKDGRSALAEAGNPNYARIYRYADPDALLELWGHIRALNPDQPMDHKLASEVVRRDWSGHVVVLGGIGWNRAAGRLQKKLQDLPIRQVEVTDLKNGEIFRVTSPERQEFRPVWAEHEDVAPVATDKKQIAAEQAEDAYRDGRQRELTEDVGFLARLPNPYNHRCTVTICSGVYSRGVLGAVRALTDPAVRERNEQYLADRFPRRSFAMLMRVGVVEGDATATDLEMPENRLYEWSPDEEVDE